MSQNILLWGLALGTFIVTLGISSWHDGLWHSDAASVDVAPVAAALAAVPAATPMRPFAPAVETPPIFLATVAPPPPAPKVEEVAAAAPEQISNPDPQSEPSTLPDVDNGEMLARQDRAAAHSARSH